MSPEEIETRILATEPYDRLKPETGKLFVWNDPKRKAKTAYSVAYLHGFTATRRETDPVPRRIAAAIGANLFYTRLSGHGLIEEAHKGVKAQDWLNDSLEALDAAKAIGERVIVIGTSTGGTLATWLALGAGRSDIAALVLISPNYKINNPLAWLLSTSMGKAMARITQGEYRKFPASSDTVSAIWDVRHHSASLVELSKIVDLIHRDDFPKLRLPVQVFYNPNDKVVDERETIKRFKLLASDRKDLVLSPCDHPENHVLAGDALSPGSNEFVIEKALSFLSSIMVAN